MKGYIPNEKIEEIKNKANIIDVISEYVALKKAGKNFVGLCPFHREKTPSFTVNPDKQMFYCFGCGEGGNIFSFLMKTNKLTFAEAARHLADKMGIALPTKQFNPKNSELGERKELFQINMIATDFFSKNFSSNIGKVARDYIQERGLSDAAVKTFRIGYSQEGWEHLKRFFEYRKIPTQLVEKVGLIIRRDNGSGHDRFRGRLMFPISDLNGNIIAFGGRVIGNGKPKYLNSPESPIYIKGENLYGLSHAKDYIRKNDYAIIVEGYFDLLILWDSGINNAVASLGTALTKNQTQLLRRFTRNVLVLFDPDEGGKSAIERSLQLFLEEGIQAKVAILPEGYDPADFLKTYGKDALETIIDQSYSMVDYYIERIVGGNNTFEENLSSINASIPFIAKIDDTLQRNLFIKRIAEALGIDQSVLKAEITKRLTKNKLSQKDTLPEKQSNTQIDKAEFDLICALIEYPDRIRTTLNENIFEYFSNLELKEIGLLLAGTYSKGEKINANNLIDNLTDNVIKKKFLGIMVTESPFNEKIIDRFIYDAIKNIKHKWYRNRHRTLNMELSRAQKSGDSNLQKTLLTEKGKLKQEEKRIH